MSLLADPREAMARIRLPGLSLATIRDGEIEWLGWGVREAGGTDEIAANTLFQACSISKAVASVVALRLHEDGALSLDDDVNGLLETWKVPSSKAWQPVVTVRHLLTHAGGLTVHGFPGYRIDEPLPTLAEILDGTPPANTPAVRVDIPPGLRWRYSGGGFCVLQQLLEDVTGAPFAALARERLFEPLQMTDSTYQQPLPARLAQRAATAHGAGGTPLAGRWHVYPELAAAGLWTTPTDLARLVCALQSHPHEQLFLPGLGGWGLGFALEGEGRSRRFGHGGDNEGFKAQLTGYVDGGLGLVVMANADSGIKLFAEVERAVAARDGWPGFAPRRPVTADPGVAAAAAGTYELGSGVAIELAVQADRLVLTVPGQDAIELVAAGHGDWFAESVNLELRLSDSGLVLVLDGDELPAARVG